MRGAGRVRGVLAISAAVFAAGCYHATIDSGRAQSGTVIEKKWAHSFIHGLVPPSPVNTGEQCPNGIAKVETQLSFLNQVATFLTFGIYSPMTIQVWCAGPGEEDANAMVLSVPEGATAEQIGATFATAAERSLETGAPVFVRLANPVR